MKNSAERGALEYLCITDTKCRLIIMLIRSALSVATHSKMVALLVVSSVLFGMFLGVASVLLAFLLLAVMAL